MKIVGKLFDAASVCCLLIASVLNLLDYYANGSLGSLIWGCFCFLLLRIELLDNNKSSNP